MSAIIIYPPYLLQIIGDILLVFKICLEGVCEARGHFGQLNQAGKTTAQMPVPESPLMGAGAFLVTVLKAYAFHFLMKLTAAMT